MGRKPAPLNRPVDVVRATYFRVAVVQENADPDVVRDLNDFFSRIVPEDDPRYRHTIEGSDDMPAHIRAALTSTQISVRLIAGRLALGTWQGIYLFEHRRVPHARTVALHLIGE